MNPLSDAQWRNVRDRCGELMDEIGPVPFDTLEEAVDDVVDEDELGMFGASSVIESAANEGTLGQHGDHLFESKFDFIGVSPEPGDDDEDTSSTGYETPDVPDEVVMDVAESSGHEFVPDALREREIWYLRHPKDKTLRAPWAENQYCSGTLQKALWAKSLDSEERAETDYGTVQDWVNAHPEQLAKYDWGDYNPEFHDVAPALLLPHDPCGLTVIDLDDVRHPETAEIHPEAARIIRKADSWGEISQSGEGIHVFVYGELPSGYGKVVEPLDDEPWIGDEVPQVEIYDHARVVAITEQHVAGTPNEVRDDDGLIDMIVDEYTDDDDVTVEDILDERSSEKSQSQKFSTASSSTSPYWSVSTRDVIRKSPECKDDLAQHGKQLQGSNPVHGSDTGMNFTLDGDMWYCHTSDCGHGGVGFGLAAVAVLGSGSDGDCRIATQVDQLDDMNILEVCLHLREWGVVSEDTKPPYRAIRGILKVMDLMDEDTNEIPSGMWDAGKSVYDNNTLSELEAKFGEF